MNKDNPAVDLYINIARDVHILSQFTVPKLAQWRNYSMMRGTWDSEVPNDVKKRFAEHEYVIVEKHFVYLTAAAKEIIGYNPDHPGSKHAENQI